jgi:hypothetical protein
MKTLIAVLISLGSGAGLGVAAVVGVQAALDPDQAVEQSSPHPINVLDYGNRG